MKYLSFLFNHGLNCPFLEIVSNKALPSMISGINSLAQSLAVIFVVVIEMTYNEFLFSLELLPQLQINERPLKVLHTHTFFSHIQFGKSLDKLYIDSRLFRQAACFFSPAVKSLSSTTPSRQSSTSPSQFLQEPVQLQISLRVFASYRTLSYLFVLWLFFRFTSMNVFVVILLWILVLVAIVLNHLTPCHKKSLAYGR